MTDSTANLSPTPTERVTPQQIADAMSTWKHRPAHGREFPDPPASTVLTDEQVAIIRADTQTTALVTAGAGSGKTETMTMRILWLVANGHARLDEILGMTFTRRAATSLSQRLQDGIDALRLAKLLGDEAAQSDALFSSTMTTYNAFANRIFTDYAHLIGEDGSARVMTEATAFNLARTVVLEAHAHELADLDMGLSDVVEAVLKVSRSLTDNMVSVDDLTSFAESFGAHVEPLPLSREKSRLRKNRDAYVWGLRASTELIRFGELAGAYQRRKRDRNLIEFSDQIAFANRLAELPVVRASIASNYRFVLLDEYQDTSSVQVALLGRLFSGLCVMAVGDPNQAIYAWRGASASNMRPERFFEAFGAIGSHAEYWLSRSWRNPGEVLDCANHIARPLAAERADGTSFLLSPGVTRRGAVTLAYPETMGEEADTVAAWFEKKLDEWPGEVPPTAAVLARRNADLVHLKLACEKRGLRTHVLGLGGLLMEPVIVDIVCTLRVIHLANSDSELIRLLAGARWRIAPRDLRALNATASWLGARDHTLTRLGEDVASRLWESVSASDGHSLVDALDYIADTPEPDPESVRKISALGIERLRDAGAAFQRLRRHAGADLRELVRMVLSEMRLDVELLANDDASPGFAEATVQTFLDTVSSFVATSEVPTLGSLIVWLEEVERRERLSTVDEDPEPGVVQLLTIHGAKGLEWDYVALTRMCSPAKGQETQQVEKWTGRGTLPEQLRADRLDLGTLWHFEEARDQVELQNLYRAYTESAGRRHKESERRLAYVGMTRAAHELHLSGSWWASGKTLRPPNEFIADLSECGLAGPALPEASAWDENPWNPRADSVRWPLPPLGARHNRVALAAQAVANAVARPAEIPTFLGPVEEDIALLLAEQQQRATTPRPRLPQRIPASQFKDYVSTATSTEKGATGTPAAAALGLGVRAMPQRPYRATLLGTLFHAWVESRYLPSGAATLFDLDEVDDVSARDVVDASDPRGLEDLMATFEQSPWAHRRPVAVETEIHLPLGPNVIVCKLDAVFAEGEGESLRYDIVDWKTGTPPRDASEREARAYQLALYRVAFSQLHNVPLERIDAALYYVADNLIVRPENLPDASELERRWLAVME